MAKGSGPQGDGRGLGWGQGKGEGGAKRFFSRRTSTQRGQSGFALLQGPAQRVPTKDPGPLALSLIPRISLPFRSVALSLAGISAPLADESSQGREKGSVVPDGTFFWRWAIYPAMNGWAIFEKVGKGGGRFTRPWRAGRLSEGRGREGAGNFFVSEGWGFVGMLRVGH